MVNTVHFILPWIIDDPRHPSGGNRYDREVCAGLRARGWQCVEHVIPGTWPQPSRAAHDEFARRIEQFAAGTLVLLDGVMAPAMADVLAAAASRLRLVTLLHMPFGVAWPALARGEQRALAASRMIITTSAWTAQCVRVLHGFSRERLRVALPGVDTAAVTPGSADGSRLLCVANVSRLKGHDLLVDALATLGDLAWQCTCAGDVEADPSFMRTLHATARAANIDHRIHYTGALDRAAVDALYADADLLVLASRREAYGMVISEALARGMPVIATHTGGIAEALGKTATGSIPGLLVEPDSSTALAAALRAWLEQASRRAALRRAAVARRHDLHGWPVTIDAVVSALGEVQDDHPD